jgi:hypothetical protein
VRPSKKEACERLDKVGRRERRAELIEKIVPGPYDLRIECGLPSLVHKLHSRRSEAYLHRKIQIE